MAGPLTESVSAGLGIAKFLEGRRRLDAARQENQELLMFQRRRLIKEQEAQAVDARFERNLKIHNSLVSAGATNEALVESLNRLSEDSDNVIPKFTVESIREGEADQISRLGKIYLESKNKDGEPAAKENFLGSLQIALAKKDPAEGIKSIEIQQGFASLEDQLNLNLATDRGLSPEEQEKISSLSLNVLNDPEYQALKQSGNLEGALGRVGEIRDSMFAGGELGEALTPKEEAQAAVNAGTATPGQREVALGRSLTDKVRPFQARKDTEEFSRIVFGKPFDELDSVSKKIASDLAQGQRLDLALAKTAGQSQVRQEQKIKAAKATLSAISAVASKVFTQSGLLERALATPRNLLNTFIQNDEDAILYQSLSNGTLAMFIRAFGDVGTLNEGDIVRARELTPTLFGKLGLPDSKEVAAKKLTGLEKLFEEVAAREPGVGNIPNGATFTGFTKEGFPVLVMPNGDIVKITPDK